MEKDLINSNDYLQFVNEIKSEIKRAQYEVYRSSNSKLIQLYWFIGKTIVERQKMLGWGKSVIHTFRTPDLT